MATNINNNGSTNMTATTAISLKGSKCWGEFYRGTGKSEYLYRLADKSFAIVTKAEWSGKILAVEPVDGAKVKKYGVENLGYAIVTKYCFKD